MRKRLITVVGLLLCLVPVGASATWPRMDQGAYVVGTAVALPQGSLSLQNNPAGLASQDHLELRLQTAFGGSDGLASRGAGYGLFAGMPFGPFGIAAAVEHVRDPAPGADFGPGLLQFSRFSGGGGITFDRWFHVGGALRIHTAQAGPVGTVFTSDVALLLTPWSWFSIGARVSDLLGATSFLLPDTIGGIIGPQYAWGWAFRYQDKIAWSFDIGWPSIAPVTLVTTAVKVKLNDEYELGFEYRHTVHNEVITGHATGSDARVAAVLRWRAPNVGAEVGVLRDFPEGDPRANGAVVGVQIHRPFKVPLWHQAMAALGLGEAGRLHERTRAGRAKAPGETMTNKQLQDTARRAALGWQPPLKGAYRREARKISQTILAFSAALANERKDRICGLFAAGRLRFDIATTDPPLNIHKNLVKEAACVSLESGDLGKYVKEFGPSHPHADIATLVPSLFAIHGSPFLHVPAVQLQAYGEAVAGQRTGNGKLACRTYRASRLPADAETPKSQRRYEVTMVCDRVAHYHIEVMGNRRGGFKVRKFSIRRLAAPQ